MEAADALELMAIEVSQIDTAFQFWLGSTFAVIVAVHSVRENITTRLKLVVVFLYVLLAIYSMVKSVGDFQQLAYLAEIASSQGFELPNDFSAIAGMIRVALYLLGTISTVIYIWLPGKTKRGAT
jgi:hypothetical protein